MAKVKGTALIGAVKRLRLEKERSVKLLPPKLHHYLHEKVVAASWYPEEDFLAIIRANMKLLGLSIEDGCDRLGVKAGQEHYKVWYGKRFSIVDSRSLTVRLPSLWSAQHDTGRYEFIIESPTSGKIEIRDFDFPSRELCLIIQSYTREFLRLAGLGDVTAIKDTCVLKGDDHCSWQFKWTKELQ